ncbi:MAG: hypothetical protein ACFCUU_03240 [Cyclobacteriaceae bacterium]
MKVLNLVFLSMLLLTSCNPDRNKSIDPDTPVFHTTDASELFFKNVRKTYYDLEDQHEHKMLIYRFSKRVQTDDKPILNLNLVINWMKDEAYVLFEHNHFFEIDGEKHITWYDTEGIKMGELSYKPTNIRSQFNMATTLYMCIKQGHTFKLQIGDATYDLLSTKAEREAFRITMYDFYRLVELL